METPEYTDLIVRAALNEPPEYLTEYFKRKQKEAAEKQVTPAEFFNRCNSAVSFFEERINEIYNKEKYKLYSLINKSEIKAAEFPDNKSWENGIKTLCAQLDKLSWNDITVDLYKIVGQNGKLSGKNLINIKEALNEARNEVTHVKENTTLQQETPGKNQKTILKAKLFELAGLNPDTVNRVYSKLYNRWKFNNSDEVRIDGRLLSKSEKIQILLSTDIKPNSKKVITSDLQDGFPLTEELFVKEQLSKYQKINDNLTYDSSTRREKNRLEIYINFLNEKLKQLETDREPEKTDIDKLDEVKNKYPNIFEGNAFEVWEQMFRAFDIKESSRTDVKFMFEVMKKDGLIHGTVTQVGFLEWINKTYEISIEKTSNYSKTAPREAIYNNAKSLYIK